MAGWIGNILLVDFTDKFGQYLSGFIRQKHRPRCAINARLTFLIKNRMMAHDWPKQERVFRCANAIEPFKCSRCANFKTHNLAHLKHHFRVDHVLLDWKKKHYYTCGKCGFQTYSEFLSSTHQLRNLCRQDVRDADLQTAQKKKLTRSAYNRLRRCEHCPYTSTDASNFRRHILSKHTDRDKIQWFECEQCPYKTKMKGNLKSHVEWKHGVTKYLHCAQCRYQTKCRRTLKRHVLTTHTDLATIQWFECAQCAYRSRRKDHLKSHVGYKHSSVKILKCGQCAFETNHKFDLKRHVGRRHSDEHVKKCDSCPYETKFKQHLRNHVLLKHTDPEKIEWFRCEHCSYKCRIEGYMKRHSARHRKPLEEPSNHLPRRL